MHFRVRLIRVQIIQGPGPRSESRVQIQVLQVPERQSNDSEGQKREEKDQFQVDDNYFITFLSMQC